MKLSAILPVCVKGSYDNIDDLGRAEILLSSLNTFVDKDLFEEFLIVCPDNEVDLILPLTSKWKNLKITVISEDVLVPEFKKYKHVRGWRKQQLIKLAAPRHLKSDFYVTFDADIICLKKLSKDLLLPDGKALMQYEDFDRHPKWWRSSSRILKCKNLTKGMKKGMSVTPAILASDISEKVTEEISKILKGNGSWVDKICQLHNPKSISNWTLYRAHRSRWTEYSLYYMCAMKHDLLSKYHVDCGTESVRQELFTRDVTEPFETWDVSHSFSEKESSLFCVVNSKRRIANEDVLEKVKDYIHVE